MNKQIRPIALGLLIVEERLLVQLVAQAWSPVPVYRPLGGGIEYRELAKTAVVREFAEETGLQVIVTADFGWVENIFDNGDYDGHEIAAIFQLACRAELQLPAVGEHFYINENGQPETAAWVPIDDFQEGRALLVPNRLAEILFPKQ